MGTGACAITLAGDAHNVASLVALPDGRLGNGSHNHIVQLWDSNSDVCIGTYQYRYRYRYRYR